MFSSQRPQPQPLTLHTFIDYMGRDDGPSARRDIDRSLLAGR